MRILITGAAGNIGSHCARFFLRTPHTVRLLVHQRNLPHDIASHAQSEIFRGDLGSSGSISGLCDGVDSIIHFAGVLFRPNPETFLHKTNTLYVKALVDEAIAAGVGTIVLVSFPHVEGASDPQNPAAGLLNRSPIGIHATTRLAAEQYCINTCAQSSTRTVVVRAGVIYGPDVKLIKAARRLLRIRMMAIWNTPTWLHLIALPDLLDILGCVVENERLNGIYNVCDDEPLFLQDFLDLLARHWGYSVPWRLPPWSFHAAATACELTASVLHTPTPLTRDILTMAMTSVVADVSRMKREIGYSLRYPSIRQGIALL